MAAIPYYELEGQGYLYPAALQTSGLGSEKTWSIGAPTCTGSAYLTFEAVRLSTGYYDGTSSTPGLAAFSDFVGIDEDTLVTSSNIFSVVIPQEGGTFKYTPTNLIPEDTMYVRGTGGITVNS